MAVATQTLACGVFAVGVDDGDEQCPGVLEPPQVAPIYLAEPAGQLHDTPATVPITCPPFRLPARRSDYSFKICEKTTKFAGSVWVVIVMSA